MFLLCRMLLMSSPLRFGLYRCVLDSKELLWTKTKSFLAELHLPIASGAGQLWKAGIPTIPPEINFKTAENHWISAQGSSAAPRLEDRTKPVGVRVPATCRNTEYHLHCTETLFKMRGCAKFALQFQKVSALLQKVEFGLVRQGGCEGNGLEYWLFAAELQPRNVETAGMQSSVFNWG